MKTSSPGVYGASGIPIKSPPDTIENEARLASGKAKARYPNDPLGTSTKNGSSGKMKVRALTPGTSPSGS